METIVTAVLTLALVVIAYSVSAKNSTKPSAPARTNEQSKPVQIKCGTEFTQEEMNEARLNATGKKTASISVVVFGVFGVIALITNATIFWVALIASALGICMGIVWLMQNRSEAVIIQDKIEAQKKAAAFVSNLVNNNFDTSSLYEKPKKKNDGTKEIIKDAVIGGVLAGPTGAVVGAIVGKEKADSNDKKNDGTKEIVKGTVVGGAIAGEAGAVVGTMVAKTKLDSEKAKN